MDWTGCDLVEAVPGKGRASRFRTRSLVVLLPENPHAKYRGEVRATANSRRLPRQ
jgi:hypothetical protein